MTRVGTRTISFTDAIDGLDVIEHHDINERPTMAYNPTSKIQARNRWKRYFGTFLLVIFFLLLTSVVEVRATPAVEQPPGTPSNANATAKQNTTTKATSDSASAALSGSSSLAGSTAVSGPSTSGANAGAGASVNTGPISVTPVISGGPTSSTSGASVSSGPTVVSPTTEMNSNSTTRALALSLPAPIAGMAATHNCLVAGNDGTAVGFNFFSRTQPVAFSDPVCTLRAMAAEADQACQYRQAAEMRSEVMAIVLKRDPRPVPDTVVDLSPEQCMLLKQPRIVMPQANTTYVDASQWQTQDVQPPIAVQSQQATPRPRPRPTPTPTPTPVLPKCGEGQTLACQKPAPAPGSFSDGLIRR